LYPSYITITEYLKQVCFGSQFWSKVEGSYLVTAFLLAKSQRVTGSPVAKDKEHVCVCVLNFL
jgi:hypothetical protein